MARGIDGTVEGLPSGGDALRCFVTVTALLLVAVAGERPATAADPAFQVIVHPDVAGTQIPRAVLAAIFLKDVKRWGDGRAAMPVDQSMRSPVRAAFSETVLQMSVAGVPTYWHRKIGRGVRPPIVKASDEEVIAFVAETEGSIGYVSPSASLPSTVKAITFID